MVAVCVIGVIGVIGIIGGICIIFICMKKKRKSKLFKEKNCNGDNAVTFPTQLEESIKSDKVEYESFFI